MHEQLVPEGLIHERLGLRHLRPALTVAGKTRVNIRRVRVNNALYLSRSDLIKLLRSESQALGGDTVLDRLANVIMEVTT